MLTDKEVAEIKARCDAATKGPWSRADGVVAGAGDHIAAPVCEMRGKVLPCFTLPEERHINFQMGSDGNLYAHILYEEWVQFPPEGWNIRQDANFDFIAHAREDISKLLADNDELRAENAKRNEYGDLSTDTRNRP